MAPFIPDTTWMGVITPPGAQWYTNTPGRVALKRSFTCSPGFTCVRIPVVGGHSESVNIEFEHDFDLNEVKQILSEAPGIVLEDDPENAVYPMPLNAHEKNETFVGRLRRDESNPKTLNCWIVSDNLRKGAATNAVQIAEKLAEAGFLKATEAA